MFSKKWSLLSRDTASQLGKGYTASTKGHKIMYRRGLMWDVSIIENRALPADENDHQTRLYRTVYPCLLSCLLLRTSGCCSHSHLTVPSYMTVIVHDCMWNSNFNLSPHTGVSHDEKKVILYIHVHLTLQTREQLANCAIIMHTSYLGLQFLIGLWVVSAGTNGEEKSILPEGKRGAVTVWNTVIIDTECTCTFTRYGRFLQNQ